MFFLIFGWGMTCAPISWRILFAFSSSFASFLQKETILVLVEHADGDYLDGCSFFTASLE